RAGFPGCNLRRAAGHLEIVQPSDCGRRRQWGGAPELLPSPSLEIAGEKKRPVRTAPHLVGKVTDRTGLAAEEAESPHPRRQRALYRRPGVVEAAVGVPADGRKDELGDLPLRFVHLRSRLARSAGLRTVVGSLKVDTPSPRRTNPSGV